jgi:D-3-phosphoglycerate dehydrogenase / 2-oxoglutarate reductase
VLGNQNNLVWMIDDEFDSYEIEEGMLQKKGYPLVVTRSASYRTDYLKFAPHVKGILLQVGFQLKEEDINGLRSCKIISVRGTGFNNTDIDAATRQGIVVTYVPGYCVEEVSDHALTLILALNRRIPECQEMTRKGFWKAAELGPIRRLREQILGLVGFGRIARNVARKAKCLGFRVMVYDPLVSKSDMDKADVEQVEFKDLVKVADFVSLHIPLTKETQCLFNAAVFKMMKNSSYLINTCRGEVVDEAALIHALRTGEIAGAGLDVLCEEPPNFQNPLLLMPNVIITPHSAYISQEALTEVLVRSTRAVIDVLEGKVPEDIINPAVIS